MAEKLSVSAAAVLCQIEYKELEEAADNYTNEMRGLIMSMKKTLRLQNALRIVEDDEDDDKDGDEEDEKTRITLLDWGRLIVMTGLMAMARAKEKEAQKESKEE